MKKIDIASIDRKTGMTTHDLLREGSAHDLDPIKVSAVIKAFADALNFCMEDLERMHKEGS